MPDIDLDSVQHLPWKNATTFPDAPHEYLTLWQAPEVYDYFKAAIAREGVKESYFLRGKTKWNRYYYAPDGYKYWLCWPILNRTLQTNRLPGQGGRPERDHE